MPTTQPAELNQADPAKQLRANVRCVQDLNETADATYRKRGVEIVQHADQVAPGAFFEWRVANEGMKGNINPARDMPIGLPDHEEDGSQT